MASEIEKMADKSIGYLKRTDALASHDYEPEIKAEIVRALKAVAAMERERCAKVARKKGFQFQDMVGWQKGESRNELVSDVTEGIYDAIRNLPED